MLEVIHDADLEVVSFYWNGEKIAMIIEGIVRYEHELLKYKFMIWLPKADQYHVPRA